MIVVHTARTTNGRKPLIALLELEVEHQVRWIDLGSGIQREPEFLAMNPYGKIPVLQDGEQAIWESGAILLHLAERFGGLLPLDPAGRMLAIQLCFFQTGGLGPHGGRLASQWGRAPEDRNAEAFDDGLQQVQRILETMERILGDGREHLAGPFSIADIMSYPWASYLQRLHIDGLEVPPGVAAWIARVGARPAVKAAYSMRPAA